MSYSSNFDGDPGAFFDEALKDFGLDSPSRVNKTVGERAVKTIAANIHERGERFEGPDGRWPDNAESTIKRKGRNAPNHNSNDMMSIDQIEGTITVAREEAAMTYGKDDACKAKAHYAETGQSRSKVVRPFFWITGKDADDVIDGVIDDLLNHLNRG